MATVRPVLVAVFLCFNVILGEIALTPLPFKEDALEPFISETTISTHYGKHHAGYVNKLNKAMQTDPKLQGVSVMGIVKNARNYPAKIVNLASQIFNHEFYWNCINPTDNPNANGGSDSSAAGKPAGMSDDLYAEIVQDYESFGKFKAEFIERANAHFGSGWVWFVIDPRGAALSIQEGHDAKCPYSFGEVPLLTIDVWEHAYYLDYKNERARYVDEYFNRINWKFVSEQMKKAIDGKTEL
mmetsp:Transcript_73181/g.116677  ORF Transcript_73181/g.116677 Transcript_73181/m.116677 type:complete len:241 (+) Transcript_73181:29-751(+)|eukprot:CAMPEP_0197028564 /NCGR_PEP_ID=MMETSP1384-20130603/8227_1 /TAXON_ID=29189 /ORGANISM="Ammonia sp." /LENGTH=240 /DNA_ID=CAMNT_0042457583 /DNA_START=26 /DNA_END=748 /DNA_ORIENTATION=+